MRSWIYLREDKIALQLNSSKHALNFILITSVSVRIFRKSYTSKLRIYKIIISVTRINFLLFYYYTFSSLHLHIQTANLRAKAKLVFIKYWELQPIHFICICNLSVGQITLWTVCYKGIHIKIDSLILFCKRAFTCVITWAICTGMFSYLRQVLQSQRKCVTQW